MQSSSYTLAESRCVSLVLPGLLVAEAVGSMSIMTPFLCRCLSHAKVSHESTSSLESVVLKWFNGAATADENGAAILGYRLDTSCPEAGQVLRADPVYQEMDINHAVLADQSVLDLNLTEAQSLADTLNQHFAEDGVVFNVADATRWYCSFKDPLDVRTTPPSKATGRDVSHESPRGSDASRWRSWLAEIEMLLYSHPVNQQRQKDGKVAVNSLWLWGEGLPAACDHSETALVCSENFYTKSAARHFGVEVCALDDFAGLKSNQGLRVLVVVDHLQRAAATADEQLRIDTLQQLEEKIFEPLWRNLRRSGWESVRIWVGADKWLQIDRQARFKFWRKQKPLNHFINHGGAVSNGD